MGKTIDRESVLADLIDDEEVEKQKMDNTDTERLIYVLNNISNNLGQINNELEYISANTSELSEIVRSLDEIKETLNPSKTILR